MSDSKTANNVFDALLFDMDGTILTSLAAAERVWSAWARRHNLDVDAFLPTMHGKRAIDTIRDANVPGIDIEAEAAQVLEDEIADVADIEAIGGAPEFLASLPADRWAIVTSAPRRLAERRLEAAGIPWPRNLISGDDVRRGKPDPDAFQTGAAHLDFPVENCLIFEDAVAGVQAAENAGAQVMVVTAVSTAIIEGDHTRIADYHGLSAQSEADGRIRVDLV